MKAVYCNSVCKIVTLLIYMQFLNVESDSAPPPLSHFEWDEASFFIGGMNILIIFIDEG